MSSADTSLPSSRNEVIHESIPLVVIIGPTAVGKTEIAIELAEIFNGEIVSADSRLFYRGMDIGTAKPTAADRLRVQHHLIDVANPDEIWSLALFQKAAHEAIQQIYSSGHLPFLVGGTGQFVHAIIKGWIIPPVEPNPQLRSALSHWADLIGPAAMHTRLAVLDPPAAENIDSSNLRRTIRAMEVILLTGRRFSDQRKSGAVPYETLLLGLTCSRPELYRRIDERINRMVYSGLVDEVQRLLDEGYSPELPTMSAIGYGEMISYLYGKIDLEEAIQLMRHRTRIFVRRQANWFKQADPDVCWFPIDPSPVINMKATISDWLSKLGR